MSNSFFRFKEFMVAQDRCAMKVTTDACIQGAWAPLLLGGQKVLDIGAGTGLLSLMLAQRNTELQIDAVELDAEAVEQARANIVASPWAERINVIAGDVRDQQFTCQYDLIITNPPFFSNSLLGGKHSKNLARHTLSLSFMELAEVIVSGLKADGYLCILLPSEEYATWREIIAGKGLYESHRLDVKHTASSVVKRVVGVFSRDSKQAKHDVLVIKEGEEYTPAFKDLLQTFYLHL